jgi:hypothetical protein
MEALGVELLDAMAGKEQVDLVSASAHPLPLSVIAGSGVPRLTALAAARAKPGDLAGYALAAVSCGARVRHALGDSCQRALNARAKWLVSLKPAANASSLMLRARCGGSRSNSAARVRRLSRMRAATGTPSRSDSCVTAPRSHRRTGSGLTASASDAARAPGLPTSCNNRQQRTAALPRIERGRAVERLEQHVAQQCDTRLARFDHAKRLGSELRVTQQQRAPRQLQNGLGRALVVVHLEAVIDRPAMHTGPVPIS